MTGFGSSGDIDDHMLDTLEFQQSLAVDVTDAFIQHLQDPTTHFDPGISVLITSGDGLHDPGMSADIGPAHDSAMNPGMSTGGHDAVDAAAGLSHDQGSPVHGPSDLGHESGAPQQADPAAFHH